MVLRNYFFLFNISLALSLAFWGCENEKNASSRKQYFNCYVNGKYWEVEPGKKCYDIFSSYYPNGMDDSLTPVYLVVRGNNCITSNSVSFGLKSVSNTKVYDLSGDSDVVDCSYKDFNYTSFDDIKFSEVLGGRLELTSFKGPKKVATYKSDEMLGKTLEEGWIEGVFDNLILVNASKDTVVITNGKFAARI